MTEFNRRAFDQWKTAPLWRRIAAQIIDQILAIAVAGAVVYKISSYKPGSTHWLMGLFLLWPFTSLAIQALFLQFSSTTPGKKVWGLKIVSARPNHPLTAWQILVRTSTWWMGLFSLGTGWSTALARRDRRAWHDLLSETLVTSEKGEPIKAHSMGKKLGQGWATAVSLIIVAAFTSAVVIQLKRPPQSGSQTIQGKPFASMSAPSLAADSLEEASWLLVVDGFNETPMKLNGVDEEKLAAHLMHFSKASTLSGAEKFDYYKANMEKDEDWFCREGQTDSGPCQSARLMASLLTEKAGTTKAEGALPVLRALADLKSFSAATEEQDYLSRKTETLSPQTPEYWALKTVQLKRLTQNGDFKKALTVVDNLHQSDGNISKPSVEYLVRRLNENSCQVKALADCKVISSACSHSAFWKDWASGCQMRVKPESFKSLAEAYGYWWNKANAKSEKIRLSEWEKTKNEYQQFVSTDFEKDILRAFDFVLAVKSSSPPELVERSKAMGKNNPLWGWAQTQAIFEFGSQWAYLINPSEKKQIAFFNLLPQESKRQVASVHSKKKKSKGGKKSRKGHASKKHRSDRE